MTRSRPRRLGSLRKGHLTIRRYLVNESGFFEGIAHKEVSWDNRTLSVPLIYYDAMASGAAFLTLLAKIQGLLPTPRMQPVRLTPRHGLTTITAYAYRDCDVGPYNEVAIGFPVTLSEGALSFTRPSRGQSGARVVYAHRLPVTTEIARDAGGEFANYSKFVADIAFEEADVTFSCRLAEKHDQVLSLTVSHLDLEAGERTYIHSLTFREGRILRLEFVLSASERGKSGKAKGARLELGDHPITDELRELGLGRVVYCYRVPRFQAVLSPVPASFDGVGR
jgi:hypothetical protein